MHPRIDQALRRASQLAWLITRRFNEDRCVQEAGNLTFTTLLALVPIFTIALTLFAAFPVFNEWSDAFRIFLLTTLVPEVSEKVITVYMQQFSDNAGKLTAFGFVFLGVTAVMLMVSIERVFNAIWRVRRPRTVTQRLVIYWTTLTVGPLLIGASLSLTSWLLTQSMQSVSTVRDVQDVLLKFLPIVLNAAAFALLYLMIPNRRVLVRYALVGGATAAVGFELMKRAFGVYVLMFPTYDLIYGAFATIPLFLLWIYLSWLVVLFGAVVVAVLPQWRVGALRPQLGDGGALYRALRLIELLHAAHRGSETPTAPQLALRSGIAEEEVEQLLETMNAAGWARRVDPMGWVLARDLATLRLEDVYRTFAVQRYARQPADGALVRGAAGVMTQAERALDVPLATLGSVEQALNEAQGPSLLQQPAQV